MKLLMVRGLCYRGLMLWRWCAASLLFLGACVIDTTRFYAPEPDAGSEPDANGYRVGGSVAGMWDGAGVSLRLTTDDVEITEGVSQNGTFEFGASLVTGTSYIVTVATQPFSHDCSVGGGIGEIGDGDASGVTVVCHGPAVDVTLSPLIDSTFDPDMVSQTVMTSIAQQETPVSVTLSTADAITLNSVPLESGVPSTPVALPLFGVNTLQIHVEVEQISRDYSLQVDRGALAVAQYDTLVGVGGAIAIDGEVMVVGARGERAAYVFRRVGSTWMQEGYLQPSVAEPEDDFGRSVALSGDSVIVGAPDISAEEAGPRVGAAYVFVRSSAGDWEEQQILAAPGGTVGNQFGWSVSIDADHVAVGAPFDQATGGNWSGAVVVFDRVGPTQWSNSYKFKAPNYDAYDQFGQQVAIRGDRLAVSALYEASCATAVGGDQSDDACQNAGAAYVFRREHGSSWPLEAYLKVGSPGTELEFAL